VAHDLYCCLLPQREALCTCRSGFPIATKRCCDQDVKVVLCEAFTKRMCDRCGSLEKRRGCCYNHSAGVVLKCAVHHERNVREEKHPFYTARTSSNRVIVACDLYCCLLPQCEALHTCRSGFPIAAVSSLIRLIKNHSKILKLLQFEKFYLV